MKLTPPTTKLTLPIMLITSSTCKLFYKFSANSLNIRGLNHLIKALNSDKGVLTITNHRAVLVNYNIIN